MNEQPTSISERGREGWFFWLSMFVLLLACTSPQRLARVPWPLAEEPARLLIVAVVVTGAPVALVMELLIEVAGALLGGRLPRLGLMLKHPGAMATHTVAEPTDAVATQVAQRLTALGFTHQPHIPAERPGALVITAAKAADPNVQSFLDHKFDAVVMLSPSPRGFGTDVAATVTQVDTIIIDTGERERLRRVAEHLCLRADALDVPTVPLSAYAGAVLSWAPLLWLTLARPRGTDVETQVLTGCLLGAVGLSVFAAYQILSKRPRLFGLRVVAAAIVLAVVPYAVKLATTWHLLFRPHRSTFELAFVPLFLAMMAPIFIGELRLRRRHAAGEAGGLGRRTVSRLCIYLGAMAIFMLGMAAMIHFEARAITEMRDMQVSDLEQGARPTSRWLRLHGRADLDRAERHGRHQSYRLYVPIVSTIDHNPVAAVLVLSQQQVQEGLLSEPEAGVGAFEGVSTSGTLDKDVREVFQDEGTEIADDVVVIEYKLTPEGFGRRAVPALWMGLPLAAFIGLVQVAARISDRRRDAPIV